MKKIKVTLLKSARRDQAARTATTVRGLGLKRINQVVELVDTPGGARHDRQGQLPGARRELNACD